MNQQEVKKKVEEFLKEVVNKYKFPADIFLEVYKVEIDLVNKVCNAYIKIDPKFKFDYPFITPSDFVIILQKLIPLPAFKVDEFSVNVYFVLGEVKEAQSGSNVPTYFQVGLLNESLDRMSPSILESPVVDLVLGFWVAKGVANILSDIFKPPELEVEKLIEYDGKGVVYK